MACPVFLSAARPQARAGAALTGNGNVVSDAQKGP
jgi:hypothetical protein